jgi:outer membrane protein OmpA-like peptidoglycan-associated protein/uncharacterized protein YegL
MRIVFSILFIYFLCNFGAFAQQNKVNDAKLDTISSVDIQAFEKIKLIDKIESYNEFITAYPNSSATKLAWERIYELAFTNAQKENTSSSYQNFIHLYPKSKQILLANQLLNERFFSENTTVGDWNSYQLFIKDYPEKSKWKAIAEDSILSIGIKTNNLLALDYCVENFIGNKKLSAIITLHDVFTNDGEKQTLDYFYNKYDFPSLKNIQVQDYELAKLGNQLLLENSYNTNDFKKFDTYIKLAAPREKAFVALQRLISDDISKRKWKLASETVKSYSHYFGKNNKNVNNLLKILSSAPSTPIKVNSVGKPLNTARGGEYLPVISSDEKQMYFCGRDRDDNIGGEDIFVSNKVNGIWQAGKLIPSLSTPETNDSPLSISPDGSMLLIFKSGILNYADKTISGWSKTIEFPKQINSGAWQADAMITSDGRGLIFSSTKVGGQNLFSHRQNYHGDILYPSDIYISLLNEKDEWGEPINLGSTINTRYSDRMPYLHPDMKTLYFSSDGHGGLGKMDIFKSTRLADTCWNCWSEPINLGSEINTNESDADFKISPSGDKAYFSYEEITYFESSVLFLLDVSGSMSGQKLETLKKATLSVGQKAIHNNSEVAILTFAGDCNQPIINAFPFSKNMDSLTLFTQKLRAVDGTPMYEAYHIACDYMKKFSNPKSKNKTITLMTDGNATGCTILNDVLKSLEESGEVFKTQTIAYDVPIYSIAYNDLKQIATFSKGKFYPTNDFEDLSSSFEGSVNEIFNVNSANYNKDIYWINLPPALRPEKTSVAKGKLVDKNNRPVSAKIRLEDLETGKIIGQSKSDPKDGTFFLVLPSGKIYGYYVDNDEYFPISNNVDLKSKNEVVVVSKDLQAVKLTQLLNEGMIVPLNNIFFDFAKSTLLSHSLPELKRAASIIKKSGFKVEIMGHTDYVGENEMNQILSEKRALSVKDFLIAEGCDAEKLVTKGYGEKMPAASNRNEDGRAKNRRVELKFVK